MNLSTARVLAALALTSGTTILSVIAYPVSTSAIAQEAQQTLTVRRLYQQVEARLAHSGKIYKALIRRRVQGGGIYRTDVTQVWVDARRELARTQTTGRLTDNQQGQTTSYTFSTVYANGTTYSRDHVAGPIQPEVQRDPVFTCNGAHTAASVILGCPHHLQKWSFSLQPGHYSGRQVLILIRKGTESDEDTDRTYTTRIYLDRGSLLPLADTTTGTINRKPMHGSTSYVSSLVPSSSLPASFFQPSSVGYRGRADQIRQEMTPIPGGFTVLWLGLDFAGGHGLPAVSLQHAIAGRGGKNNFSIQLDYMPAGHPFAQPLLYMEDYPSSAARRHPQPPAGPWRVRRQTVKLANGHAVILSGRGRNTMAYAYIGSTTVLVQPGTHALSSMAALKTLIGALRPYRPSA